MELDLSNAEKIAQAYFKTDARLKCLGWGISGYVFLSPDKRTAVKVHRREEGFRRELEVYQQLRQLRISELHGLTIPKLRDYDESIRLIQMDFVNAPYLLDFAGVGYDPPDFSEDTMADWHASISGRFGPNAHVAYAVYTSLAKFGLYYTDFRATNLNLTGLPGIEAMPTDSDDD